MRTKRAFEAKQKAFFIIFKGISVAKTCLRPESAPLICFGRPPLEHTIKANFITFQTVDLEIRLVLIFI